MDFHIRPSLSFKSPWNVCWSKVYTAQPGQSSLKSMMTLGSLSSTAWLASKSFSYHPLIRNKQRFVTDQHWLVNAHQNWPTSITVLTPTLLASQLELQTTHVLPPYQSNFLGQQPPRQPGLRMSSLELTPSPNGSRWAGVQKLSRLPHRLLSRRNISSWGSAKFVKYNCKFSSGWEFRGLEKLNSFSLMSESNSKAGGPALMVSPIFFHFATWIDCEVVIYIT